MRKLRESLSQKDCNLGVGRKQRREGEIMLRKSNITKLAEVKGKKSDGGQYKQRFEQRRRKVEHSTEMK